MWYLWISVVFSKPDLQSMVRIGTAEEIPEFWIDQYEYPNRKGHLPVSGISLEGAKELCKQSGKRLCTAAEWRAACVGTSQFRFSYSDEIRRGACHQSPSQSSSHTSMMKDQFVESGSFPECHSSEQVYDMVGNVEEWVLDSWRGSEGALEGGASYTQDVYADCTGRYSRMPDYRLTDNQRIFSAGTRCCWSETPLTSFLINVDSKRRVQPLQNLPDYNPTDEVQIHKQVWMDRYEYPNKQGAFPLSGVNWHEAQELCGKSGKRLCSVYEWEQACASNKGQAFSMGDHYIKGGCALELNEAAPSGSFRGCTTDSGVSDLTGSLWEWTDSEFNAPSLQVGLNDEMKAMAEIRGGSWMVEPSKGVCHPSDGYPVTSKKMAFEDVGFRCCRGEEWVPKMMTWGALTSCPDGMLGIGRFCIDQFEYPNERGATPKKDLSWDDAQNVCEAVGKRVCTESEWTLACEGPDWKGYPYGSEYTSGKCATKDDKGLELSTSGQFEQCVTPDGIFDMTGSVWEWTAKDDGLGGVLRGGGSVLSAGLGRCRSRAYIQETNREDVGVRCCSTQSIEP